MSKKNGKILHKIQIKKFKQWIIVAVVACVFIIFPMFTSSNYLLSVIVNCFIFSSLGVAWNIIGGYGGQFSLCHSAFAAIGAYTSILMFQYLGWSPIFSLPIGMLISYLASTLIGSISFRFRGPFFAITTIAFLEIIRVLLLNFSSFTGGSAGVTVPFTGANAINLLFKNDTPFYYITFALLVIAIFVTIRFEKSKMGYYLKSIKGDEDASISLGINTSKVKLKAFQISAILTSAIGTIYAFFMLFVQPNTICSVDMSIRVISVVIIGGIGTIWGPVIGAFVLVPLAEVANILLGAHGGSQLLYGLAIIVVVVIQPKGLLYLFNKEALREAALSRKTIYVKVSEKLKRYIKGAR